MGSPDDPQAAIPRPQAGNETPITILMAVRNGMPFLPEQVASILAQDRDDWRLLVSDDGSDDGSAAFLAGLQAAHPGRITLMPGPGRGYGNNFRALILACPADAGLVALCDQDDIWRPDRLSRAVAGLHRAGEIPAIALAGRETADARLQNRKPAPLPIPRLSFRNALFESLLPGNVMMLNRAAFSMIRTAMARCKGVSSHDWLIYQLATGAGMRLIPDEEPTVTYRQHDANLVGAGRGARQLARRMARFSPIRYARSLQDGWACLLASTHLLTAENRALLHDAARLPDLPVLARWRLFRRNGYHRLGRRDQAMLALVVLSALSRHD